MNSLYNSYFQHLKRRRISGFLYRKFWLYPVLNRILKGKTLDVGCGIGDMLKFRANTVGVDINDKTVEYCRGLGLDAHVMKVDELPFKDESFDSVVMDNVLEHIADPNRILSEVRRVLVQNGILVVGVPGERGFNMDSDHKVFYDERKLTLSLTQNGFLKRRLIRMPFPIPFGGRFIKIYCLYGVFKKT